MWSGKDLRFGMMSVVVALDLALLWCEGGKCMSEIGPMRKGGAKDLFWMLKMHGVE